MSYIVFARWFGVISLILSLGILFNLENAKTMARHMVEGESGYIMGGVLPIIFGTLALTLSHSFTLSWQFFVTLIGLLMMLLGTFRVVFVNSWQKLMTQHVDKIPVLFSLFGLMFGLLLLYIGFFAPIIA